MIEFYYTNHQGITRLRIVDPKYIRWMEDPVIAHLTGWFLVGDDLEANEERSFYLDRIKWINDHIYDFTFRVMA